MREDERMESLFEETVVKSFPILRMKADIQIQEGNRTTARMNLKRLHMQTHENQTVTRENKTTRET